ncbi:DMT family transporter [Patescibacteria group bacterium]
MRKYGAFFIIFAAFLWSADALLRKPLTESLSSSTIVFYEHLFGVIILLPILIKSWKQFKKLSRKEWWVVLFIGVGGSALATYFFTSAFIYASPSVAILLQKTQPIIAIALASLLLKERLVKSFWFWTVIALGGAYVISFPNGMGELTFENSKGVWYALLAAFFWGGSTVMGKFALKRLTFPALTSLRLTIALFFLLFFITAQRGLNDLGLLSAPDIWRIILITIFTGTGALLVYYYGLRFTKASVATIAELFFPFSAVVLNWIFLGEKLVGKQIIGGILLVGAIYMVQRVGRKYVEPHRPKVSESI